MLGLKLVKGATGGYILLWLAESLLYYMSHEMD